MSATIHAMDALHSGLIEAVQTVGIPAAVLATAGTVGTGLASVAAILSYPGGSAPVAPRGAERRPGWITRLAQAMVGRGRRHRATAGLDDLNCRMLRDIGLSCADIAALRAGMRERNAGDERFVFRPDI